MGPQRDIRSLIRRWRPHPQPESEPEPEPQTETLGPPRFEWRALWMPKRGNDEREWEDGFAADAAGGILAVADGAGDGIFSKLWADLLLSSFVAQPVALDDPAAVEPWIQERRREWFEAIRYPEQRWSIQMKIDRSCGAATFFGFRLDPAPADGGFPGGSDRLDGLGRGRHLPVPYPRRSTDRILPDRPHRPTSTRPLSSINRRRCGRRRRRSRRGASWGRTT